MQRFYDEEPSVDLKNNGFEIDKNFKYDISVATSYIKNKYESKKLGRELGDYVIINSPNFIDYDRKIIDYTYNVFFDYLQHFFADKPNKILVVGIGNEFVEADCFGPLCINKLKLKENIFAIKPNVYDNTNIMSFDIVNGICKILKPDVVIAIDSLGTRNIKRLTTSFQISNVGLQPGGALSNQNKIINFDNLKIPCVVIGVPSMMFADGLNENLESRYKNIILTPKDVRITLDYCADIIVKSFDKLF